MGMLLLLLVLVLGIVAGWFARRQERLIQLNRHLTRYALWALLFFMGTKLAINRGLFAKDLGAFFLAIASSVLMLVLYVAGFALWAWLTRNHRSESAPEMAAETPEHRGQEMLAVALNSGWILAGFLVFLWLPSTMTAQIPVDAVGDWLLRLLLLSIGFDLGVELHKLDFRKLALPMLLVPFFNILFSLGCGLVFSLFTRLSVRESLLLYSGLGWYSLSSVLIAGHGMALLAILAFIHNVFRELLTIVTVPFIARISPYLPIYLGGATAMDVTLPFIQKYCGREYTLVAFYSGVICSLAVIPLVRLILWG
ncbi:MAG: lysine exporter LysO family protein [Holophaga sp.]|nr:lysine exporter LysO family protein [Holophaga sp.]